MVVVIILGILAAVVVPMSIEKPCEARIVKAKQDMRAIESALEMYRLDNYQYPSSDQGLEALVVKPNTIPEPKNWKQYMKRQANDPWGNPYQYMLVDDDKIEIITLGADGVVGGEKCNSDIKNTDL